MPAGSQAFSDKRVFTPPAKLDWVRQFSIDVVPQNTARSAINVVETLDEDSRDEGCFKNKKVFIEESSSSKTILKVSPKCSTGRSCETMPFCLQISA